MINLEIIDNTDQHFIVRGDEPYRIEISVTDYGSIICHVYAGIDDNAEQDPAGGYDGTVMSENNSWTWE